MQLHPEFGRLIESVSELRETMARNTAILEVNTDQLKEHMRRTDLLEDQIELHRRELDAKMEEALLPIKTVRALAKLGGYVAAIASGIGAVIFFIRLAGKLL